MSLLIKKTPLKEFLILYYENISSPFLVWKMYLDIIYRIPFNVSERFILPVFISNIKGNCRNFTACTKETCPGLKRKTIETLFYKKLVEFCLYVLHASCKNVNDNFIHKVFNTYNRGRTFLVGS